MPYAKVGKDSKSPKVKRRYKCVDPGAKPNWSALHKKVKSSFNGEKLMTTKYVSKGKRKAKTEVIDGWRGNGFGRICEAAFTPERFGIIPPSWFRCSKPVSKLVK